MTTVIHIGYWKTGTTTLQADFFPALPECSLVMRRDDPEFEALVVGLYHGDESRYVKDGIAEYLNTRATARTLLISDENLCGTIFKRSYNWARNAQRLHELLPTAKILVTVRQQATMLRSVYALYIHRGGYKCFADFVHGQAPGVMFNPEQLCYDALVARYQALFGPRRVCVMPYEVLLSDPARFLRDIVSFIGLDEGAVDPDLTTFNRSLSPPSRCLLRTSNRLFRRSAFNPRPLVVGVPGANRLRRFLRVKVDPRLFASMSRALSDRDEAVLQDLLPSYGASNLRLAALTSLPLAEHGYPLPEVQSTRG